MELKEICGYGAVYLFIIAWIVSVCVNGYINNKNIDNQKRIHEEYINVTAKHIVDLIRLERETVLALATQKSMILVQDPETGGYTLRALDTASKEYVRQYLEKNFKAVYGTKENKEKDQ